MISRIKNEIQRLQYIDLSIEGNWDTRTLQRNIQTLYVDRILISETTSEIQPKNIIKDPYILEFYGLPNDIKLTEKKLETALINHIQQFLMELGKGFAFVRKRMISL